MKGSAQEHLRRLERLYGDAPIRGTRPTMHGWSCNTDETREVETAIRLAAGLR